MEVDLLDGSGLVSGARSHPEQGGDVSMALEDVDYSDGSMSEDENEDEEDSEYPTSSSEEKEIDEKFKAPIIMPRRRFSGHRNMDTIKDGAL